MEYCIDVLVETFRRDLFRRAAPHTSALGTAYRAEELKRFFWHDRLYVEPHPPLPFLLSRLPASWRTANWTCLGVGGTLWSDFEQAVNVDEFSDAITTVRPLFHTLLDDQLRWAVFCCYQCDQIAVDYRHTVEELCDTVVEAYRWNDKRPKGFCSISAGASL